MEIVAEPEFLSNMRVLGGILWFPKNRAFIEVLIFQPGRRKKGGFRPPERKGFEYSQEYQGKWVCLRQPQLSVLSPDDVSLIFEWIEKQQRDELSKSLVKRIQNKPPNQYLKMKKAAIKTKVKFARIMETERGQLLLVIKPLPDESCEVSAITWVCDQLLNKKFPCQDLRDAQQFVGMFPTVKAMNVIAELNGEKYDYGIYFGDSSA